VIPHKMNGKLLLLALVGILLYFISGAIFGMTQNEGLEDDWGTPAVSKEKAGAVAVEFASKQLGLSAAKTQVSYDADKYMSGYKVRSRLSKAYEDAYQSKVPLEYWLVKVTGGSPKQTFHIKVDLEKPEVRGWSKMPAGYSLDEKGLVAAQKTIHERGFSPDEWLYESALSVKAGAFVFVNKAAVVGEAPLQLKVGVQNGQAVSFLPAFEVPQSYMDYIKPQERLAQLMTFGSIGGTFILGVVALIYAIIHGRDISFRRGIFLTLSVLVIYVVSNLNVAAGMLDSQLGSDAEAAVAKVIATVFIIGLAVITALSMWLSLLVGEQQWRRVEGWNSWPRWRDRQFGEEVFYGMGRGYLICFFILGMQQVLFLIAGGVFNSYAVPDPSQSVYNMLWPALFPLLAWLAAISEEIIYRMFGIIIFKKLLRNTFLAILIPNLIWALGHTGYSIYPSYTRLIEVAVLGFIFAYTFLRYGLITAIFAHAVMDSLLMAIGLMISYPDAKHIGLGLFYIALPALIGYAVRYLHPRLWKEPKQPPAPPLEPRLEP